jgi:hypothetical protein
MQLNRIPAISKPATHVPEAMKQQEGIGSHHLPRFLLRRFAYWDTKAKSERLWVYQRNRRPYPKGSPKSLCRVEGYFRLGEEADAEAAFETKLNKEYETEAHAFIPCLDSDLSIIPSRKDDYWRDISQFFSLELPPAKGQSSSSRRECATGSSWQFLIRPRSIDSRRN